MTAQASATAHNKLRSRANFMLLRATMAQNVGTGCAFSGLGISILALQQRYDASLGAAALTLSLTVLSMTALGPLIAGMIARWGLRIIMSAGVAISLIGYVALAFAPNLATALAVCALLIGPGAALFAALPPAILASGWFPDSRGKVMGITYLPLLITFLPILGIRIIQEYGLTYFFMALAGMHFLLLPLMLGVADPPAESSGDPTVPEFASLMPTKAILMTGIFWMIMLGDGILNGAAITGSAHMLPIVTQYGVGMEAGAFLLSLSGGASIIGSLLAGYATDRIGPAITLALAAAGFTSAWTLISATAWMPGLIVASCLTGLSGAAVFPPISALVVRVFGVHALPKILGLLGVLTLPFTFAMSPAAGWLHDISGTYRSVFTVMVASCLIATLIFFAIGWRMHRQPRALSA